MTKNFVYISCGGCQVELNRYSRQASDMFAALGGNVLLQELDFAGIDTKGMAS